MQLTMLHHVCNENEFCTLIPTYNENECHTLIEHILEHGFNNHMQVWLYDELMIKIEHLRMINDSKLKAESIFHSEISKRQHCNFSSTLFSTSIQCYAVNLSLKRNVYYKMEYLNLWLEQHLHSIYSMSYSYCVSKNKKAAQKKNPLDPNHACNPCNPLDSIEHLKILSAQVGDILNS